MMDRREIIDRINVVVDNYHALPIHPELVSLEELRRDLVFYNHRLALCVRQAYGKQELTDVQRRYLVAREITKALDDDLSKAKAERRPFNQIEIRTEALDFVLRQRKEALEAESEYEEIKSVTKSVDHCLRAMSQEISSARKERDYQAYTGDT